MSDERRLSLRRSEALGDRQLVANSLEGDEAAFAALVERYGAPVISLCYSSTLDRAEAEDLAQEIFLSVWRNLEGFRGESSFSTWLFALARNACVDRSRRQAARPQLATREAKLEDAAQAETTDPMMMAAVFQLATQLSAPLREALLLRDVQGLSYEEIALTQGVPVGTVRSRIASARLAIVEGLRE